MPRTILSTCCLNDSVNSRLLRFPRRLDSKPCVPFSRYAFTRRPMATYQTELLCSSDGCQSSFNNALDNFCSVQFGGRHDRQFLVLQCPCSSARPKWARQQDERSKANRTFLSCRNRTLLKCTLIPASSLLRQHVYVGITGI